MAGGQKPDKRGSKGDTARYVVVPIVTAFFGALATVGTAYVTETGFAEARDKRVTPAEAPTVVPTLHDPNYEGVEIQKDVRIIDLRGRVPVPPEKKTSEKISSATWVRNTLMRKVTQKRFVEFEFATSGAGIDARSLDSQIRAHYNQAAALSWRRTSETRRAED